MYEPNGAADIHSAAEGALNLATQSRSDVYLLFNDTLVRVEPTDEPHEIRQHWSDERIKRYPKAPLTDERGITLEGYRDKWLSLLDCEKALSNSYLRIREMVGAMDYEYPEGGEQVDTIEAQKGMWSHTEQKVAERDQAHKILAANTEALSKAYLRLRNIIGNMHNSPHGSEGAEAMYAFTEEELDRRLNGTLEEALRAGRGYRRARGALQLAMNRVSEALNENSISIEDRATASFEADLVARINLLAGQRDDTKRDADNLKMDVDGLMRTPFHTSLHAEVILQEVVDALAEAIREDSFKIVSWAPGMIEDWALSAIRSLRNESGFIATNWTFDPSILQETYDALAAQLEIPTVRVTTVHPMDMKTRLLVGIAELAQQRYNARNALLDMQGQRDEALGLNRELIQEHSQRALAIQSIRSQVERTPAEGDTLEWKVCWLADEYLRMQKLLQDSPHIEGALLTMQTQRDEAIEANMQSWTRLPKNQVDAIYNVMERVGGLFGGIYWKQTGLDDQCGSPGFRNFRQNLLYLYSTWRAACDQLGYTVYNPSSPMDGTDAR